MHGYSIPIKEFDNSNGNLYTIMMNILRHIKINFSKFTLYIAIFFVKKNNCNNMKAARNNVSG